MATIVRSTLVKDILFWIPDQNKVVDADLLKIVELVIILVGDDDTNYAEVLCKSLEAVALKNMTNESTSSGGLKKEVIGEHEKEYFKGAIEESWGAYIESLKDICPLFGYSPPAALGISICPGDAISTCPEPTTEGFL